MDAPEGLLFTRDHEWIRLIDESSVRLGISDFAQDELGDILFVELPELGARYEKGDTVVEVESSKTVGEAFAPFDGEILRTNGAVVDSPELINEDPYGEGWLVEMRSSSHVDADSFLSVAEYRDLTE